MKSVGMMIESPFTAPLNPRPDDSRNDGGNFNYFYRLKTFLAFGVIKIESIIGSCLTFDTN